MRHQKAGRKFGRKSAPRHALFSNLVAALIEHERIQTTDAKAKELRRIAERTISWATSVGNLVGAEKSDDEDRARVVHAMRMARRVLKHPPALSKLFSELGPRLVGRPGGYTRIMKLGNRHGDAAPMSIIELVDRSVPQAAKADEPAEETRAKGKTKAAKAETAVKAEAATKAAKRAPKAKKEAETAEKPARKPAKTTRKKTDE
jgi:large subunit ribosomal protein L17